jgi:hypothetical protein
MNPAQFIEDRLNTPKTTTAEHSGGDIILAH